MKIVDYSLSKSKLWAVIGLTIALGSVLGVAGYRLYHRWQPEHLAKNARVYIEKGDYSNATLLARRALQMAPGNADASRIMAETTEKYRMPESVFWIQHLVDIEKKFSDKVALVAAALQFGQIHVAEETLGRFSEAEKKTGEYHASAAAVAMVSKKYTEAEKEYAVAAQLDPKNESYIFNRAMAQFQLAGRAEEARATMEKLRESSALGANARRALVKYFLATNQISAALARSAELQSNPGANVNDRVIYLDLLQQTNSPKFAETLQKYQADAATRPADVNAILGWMNAAGKPSDAIKWVATLSPEMAANPIVAAPLAACYRATKDWAGLDALVRDANWGELEYLRLAFFALTLRQEGDANGFRARWNAAMTAGAKRPDAIRKLAQLGLAWGWEDEVRDLLWIVAEDSKDPNWALQLLYKHYLAGNDTRGLHRVFARMADLDPSNELVQNNFAMYSLLLKSNVGRAFEIAHDLYAKHRTDPGFASTYAYALHVQGRTQEAMAVMDSLQPAQLEDPSTAAYYGVLLVANGETEKAPKFLDLAKKARLLPEEVELVNEARRELQ